MSGGIEQQPRQHDLIGGRYELEALIGKGGVGEVWRARHVALNSPVAIKFLQGTSAQKEAVRRRFTTEAQVTAQLRTPNAVQVFDFGVSDEGHPYLVMELLEGETLGRRLERLKTLPPSEVARVLGQCARALQRAHQLGIVHRDFKPENVIICVDDQGNEQVKVLDFGIAKLVGALEQTGEHESAALPASSPTSITFSAFTRTGAVLGTPLYMAPEQVKDPGDVDLRADIWAFGVVAYQCLTGRVPFTAETLQVLFERILGGLHTRASFAEETVPPAFDDWFEVACSPHREKRFGSAIVAFRQLATSLGVAARDDSLPATVVDPVPGTEERRVLVLSDASPSGRPSGPGSIGRIGLRTTERPPRPSPVVPLAASRTLDAPPPASSKGLWIVGALVVMALASVAIWMGVGHGRDPATTSTATPAPLPQPSAPTLAPSVEANPVVAPPPSSSELAQQPSSAAPAASPRLAPPRPVNGVTHPAAAAATSVVTAAVIPAPTVTAMATVVIPAPTPPSPPPADPGSYR